MLEKMTKYILRRYYLGNSHTNEVKILKVATNISRASKYSGSFLKHIFRCLYKSQKLT